MSKKISYPTLLLLFFNGFILQALGENSLKTSSFFTQAIQQLESIAYKQAKVNFYNTHNLATTVRTTKNEAGVNDLDFAETFNENPLDLTEGFNFFVEEDVTLLNGDIESAVALGGDLILSGSIAVASNNGGNYTAPGDNNRTGLYIGGGINFN